MKILDLMAEEGFEQVIALSDPSCGLAGFMVLHDTSRGPATGGIRLYPYQNEELALAGTSSLMQDQKHTLEQAGVDFEKIFQRPEVTT